MTLSRAFVGLVFVSALYLGVLVWLDTTNHVFRNFTSIIPALPGMLALALGSYLVRYGRWFWLLRRAGYSVPLLRGYLAYTAGFAFTVTPGKVGELVRIRYFSPLGVSAPKVVSAFVMERAYDLVVVLGLSLFIAQESDMFFSAFVFVGFFLSLLMLVAIRPIVLSTIAQILKLIGLGHIVPIIQTIQEGTLGCRVWMTVADVFVCIATGFVAWALTAYAFIVLLDHVGVVLPLFVGMSVYPLSMLVGAASMLPGGIGSTEAAIVVLLRGFEVQVDIAVACAVGIRLTSIWFAVLSGFLAVFLLEVRQNTLR